MIRTILLASLAAGSLFLTSAPMLKADTIENIIVIGHVKLADGSPPPFTVSVERECSDVYGDAPGPLTDKKGQWIWRMEIDTERTRSCYFLVRHDGYISTRIDASNLNLNHLDTTIHVPDIILNPAIPDPYTIRVSGDDFPGKAKGPFNKAMKALDAHNMDEAIKDLQAAVDAAPKFSEGWHALGVVYDKSGNPKAAKDAYEKAIDANPKLPQSYVTLARVCLKLKDWQCAADTSDRMLKIETKHPYPEIYLHQAVARFELKDLDAAQKSAEEMIRLDPQHKFPRVEYVLGRILEEKGDINGAREHMMKYLELEATSPDAEQVQAHMLALGKPEAVQINPDLEVL